VSGPVSTAAATGTSVGGNRQRSGSRRSNRTLPRGAIDAISEEVELHQQQQLERNDSGMTDAATGRASDHDIVGGGIRTYNRVVHQSSDAGTAVRMQSLIRRNACRSDCRSYLRSCVFINQRPWHDVKLHPHRVMSRA